MKEISLNKHKMEKLLYKIVFFFVDIVQNTTLYKKLLNILYYFDNKHSVLKINTLTNNHSTYFDLILHANFQIFINDIVKNAGSHRQGGPRHCRNRCPRRPGTPGRG